ncbi:hypothetical protein PanWU01x14_254730, partial [Parasponia andersonii]
GVVVAGAVAVAVLLYLPSSSSIISGLGILSGFSPPRPFDARAVMGFGILNRISIGPLYHTLGFNSVGFYQTLFFRKQFSSMPWISSPPYNLCCSDCILGRFQLFSFRILFHDDQYYPEEVQSSFNPTSVGPFLDGLLTNQNAFAFNYTPQVLLKCITCEARYQFY